MLRREARGNTRGLAHGLRAGELGWWRGSSGLRGQDGVTLPRGLSVGDPHLNPAEQGHLGQQAERFCWFKQKLDGKNKRPCTSRGARSLLRTQSGSGELFVIVTFGEQDPFSDQAWPCLLKQGFLLQKVAPTLLCGQIQTHSGSGHCSRPEKNDSRSPTKDRDGNTSTGRHSCPSFEVGWPCRDTFPHPGLPR